MNFNYEYKRKEKKNGNIMISVRDYGESALLEIEKKENKVVIVTRRIEKTSKFTLPMELFEKIYKDITENSKK